MAFCNIAKKMLKETSKAGIVDMLHFDYFMWEMFDKIENEVDPIVQHIGNSDAKKQKKI